MSKNTSYAGTKWLHWTMLSDPLSFFAPADAAAPDAAGPEVAAPPLLGLCPTQAAAIGTTAAAAAPFKS